VCVKKTVVFALMAIVLGWVGSAAAVDEQLVVYTARKQHLIKPLFEAFTAKTGIAVKAVTGQAGPLLERLKAEGAKSPADVFVTTDAGYLWHATELGLLAPVDSDVLKKNLPENRRDAQNRWFALSVRARTIVYNTQKAKADDFSTYEDLADPKWKGKLCVRSSKSVYNQSLVATMLARAGEADVEKVVSGWVANLATKPFSDDEVMLKDVASGHCVVGIANSYYVAEMLEEKKDTPITVLWANQGTSGVHQNVAGAGMTAHAKHKDAARLFLEWMSGEEAQQMIANMNHEFPANPAVKPDAIVQAWGEPKVDAVHVAEAGRLQAAAIKLMDRVGYK
jgi:iron(III) transport system substrate-binding protein